MAINQLKAGALLSYASIALSNIIAIIYTPFMLRMLGQSEYGLFALVSSVVAYLTILDLGFGNAIVRYSAQYRAEGKTDELYSLFGMFMAIFLLIGFLSFLAGLGLYFNVNTLFGKSMSIEEIAHAKIMMLLLVFNLVVTFPLSVYGSIITAYENFVFQKVVNIARIVINPLIMIPLLLMGYKAIGMVVLMTVLNILSLLLNWWFCVARLKIKIRFEKFNWSLLKEVSQYSFYVFLAIVVDKIYWSTGQFVLGVVSGTSAVAVFSIAIQLLMYYLSFSLAISGVFLPRITAMITNNSSNWDLTELFIRTGRLQYLILGCILLGFILFGKSFIGFWAGSDYLEAYYMTLVIILPLTIPSIQNLGITILQAKNKHKFRSVLYVVVAILSLLLSIPFAKLYGGIGCSVAIAVALIAGNIVAMNIYYQRSIKLNMGLFWKIISKMTVPLAIIGMVGFLMNLVFPVDSLFLLSSKIIIFTIIYGLGSWFFVMNAYEKELLSKPVLKLYHKFK